ncbi:MAG TPA: TauD/TfdA family dioxygenase [Acidimicrobiales bacterium]|jgi:taurine dioxygenase
MSATTTADPASPEDPGADLKAKRVHIDAYGIDVGPIGHLAAERRRLEALEWEHFTARRRGATIGADIEGIDLTGPLSDEAIAEIRAALLAYKVIFFAGQPFTPAQHVAFAQRFGELEIHPFIPANTDQPELVRFEKGADVGGYENGWHSDVSWRLVPSLGAVLHAVEVPATGGDTLFCDMGAAYDGLDDATKAQIDGLIAVHDFGFVFGRGLAPDKREEMRQAYPPAEHPVVRTHPETGRKLLYVNRFFTHHIVGLSPEDSHALLDRLCRTADTIEYQCRFQWSPHAVAFWDNRAVQHYACSDYWPSIRIMERASIVGDRPS